jgi:hypothetical protein
VLAFGVSTGLERSSVWRSVYVYPFLVRLDELAVDVDRLAEICARFGVARLDVFGSFARRSGGHRTASSVPRSLRWR